MATAFDMSAEEVGDAMAKLAKVYQIPITEMSKLGDAINYLCDDYMHEIKLKRALIKQELEFLSRQKKDMHHKLMQERQHSSKSKAKGHTKKEY